MSKDVGFKELARVVDNCTISTKIEDGEHFVSCEFSFQGVRFKAQFDSNNRGLYGFTLEEPRKLFFGENDAAT